MTLFTMSIFANTLASRELCGYISAFLSIHSVCMHARVLAYVCVFVYYGLCGKIRGNHGSTLQVIRSVAAQMSYLYNNNCTI